MNTAVTYYMLQHAMPPNKSTAKKIKAPKTHLRQKELDARKANLTKVPQALTQQWLAQQSLI